MEVVDRVDLECRSGSKDAVYFLQLVRMEGGFGVNYQNGRRGGTLTSGTKTKSPVTEEAARKIFDKVVREKLTSQPPYVRVGDSGQAFQPLTAEMMGRSTGLLPQLLNDVPEGMLEELFRSPDWAAQVKVDGERRPVRVSAAGVTGANRRGLEVPLPTVIAKGLEGLVCELDAEIVDDHLHVFDVLSVGETDLRGRSFEHRCAALCEMANLFGSSVTVVGLARTEDEKRLLWERTLALGQEGVVFKRLDSHYVPGRPASGGTQLRAKHRKDASVVVMGANGDRRSVRMGVYEQDGRLREVGSVTIPPNQAIPQDGAVIDVKYLYLYGSEGSLFQPTFKRVRTDLVAEDAVASRLVLKAPHIDIDVRVEKPVERLEPATASAGQDTLF